MIKIDPELITVLAFGSMLVLLVTGLPVSFALGGLAILFAIILWGPEAVSIILYSASEVQTMYLLVSVPLFIYTGLILQESGIADNLFDTIRKWASGLSGGLAVAVVGVCAIFAAMVGISGAATVAMGVIALPAMLKRGYSKELAMGTIMAGGALGILIPPSICFVIYGIVAGQSIGQLFLSGIFPGLLLAFLFIIYILLRCYFQPQLGPALAPEERGSWKEKIFSLKSLVVPIILIFIIMGLIVFGVTTPTESAAAGAIAVSLYSLINKRLNWSKFTQSLLSTTKITGMVGWIIIAAIAFGKIYAGLGATQALSSLLKEAGLGPWGSLILMQLSFIVLGCFLDDTAILYIAAPLYIPIVASYGFSLVWWGTLYIMTTEMAFLTPPFGYNLFFMRGVAPKEISTADIYRSVVPFVGLQGTGLAIVMAFPQIALWLPNKLAQQLFGG